MVCSSERAAGLGDEDAKESLAAGSRLHRIFSLKVQRMKEYT